MIVHLFGDYVRPYLCAINRFGIFGACLFVQGLVEEWRLLQGSAEQLAKHVLSMAASITEADPSSKEVCGWHLGAPRQIKQGSSK